MTDNETKMRGLNVDCLRDPQVTDTTLQGMTLADEGLLRAILNAAGIPRGGVVVPSVVVERALATYAALERVTAENARLNGDLTRVLKKFDPLCPTCQRGEGTIYRRLERSVRDAMMGRGWDLPTFDAIADKLESFCAELAALRADKARLRECLTQIVKRNDWTSGECRHYARMYLDTAMEADRG